MFSFYLSQIELEELNKRTLEVYHPLVLSGADDHLIYCEHPTTISLGKNFRGFKKEELSLDDWRKKGFSVVQCDRGGQATYHGPGHLMIYPVINLRKRGLGVKKFVDIFLESIQDSLKSVGIPTFIDRERLGLWVSLEPLGNFKIVSLGVRVDRGITRHGASLYVDGDLEPFNCFSPCGDSSTRPINIKKIHENSDLLLQGMDFSLFKYILMEQISNNLRSALVNS